MWDPIKNNEITTWTNMSYDFVSFLFPPPPPPHPYWQVYLLTIIPGDFATKVKQINSQSGLIWMSSFAGPSYLTIRSSVYIILIWDPYISNLYNLWQTWCIYICRKPCQCGLHFNEQITRTHFLSSQPSIRSAPAQVILLWKGPPKLCIECHLVPLWPFPPKSLVTYS